MQKFLHYVGIAALGFLTVASIGITLGASTMLACYLTTRGIDHAERAAVQEVKALEAQPQTPAPERPEDRRTWASYEPEPQDGELAPLPLPEDEDRRAWARYEQTGEIVPTGRLDAMLPPLPEEVGRTVTLKETAR